MKGPHLHLAGYKLYRSTYDGKIELSWAAAEAPRACISWPQTDRQIDRDDREARYFTTQRIRRRYSRSLPSSSTRLDEIRFTSTLSVK